MKTRFWIIASLVGAAALYRVLPHPPNFTPVAAMALFGGAKLDRKLWAFAVPLLAMLLSDLALEVMFGWGIHALMPVVYTSFAAVVALGWSLRGRLTVVSFGTAAVIAPTLFFITTNFGVWAMGSLYPQTLPGLLACYTAAVPFYAWSLLSCVTFSAMLFSGAGLLERQFPALAGRA